MYVVEMLGSVLQLTMSLSSASMGPLAGVFLMGMFLPIIDSTVSGFNLFLKLLINVIFHFLFSVQIYLVFA